MANLSITDSTFVLFETAEAPMHIAGLWFLEVPNEKPASARKLYSRLLGYDQVKPPFNCRLAIPVGGFPRWEVDPDFELANHIHLITLPTPGSQAQLLASMSRIHGQILDRSAPLWQFYLFAGMEDGRLAISFKCHHAMFDGIHFMRMVSQCCTAQPEDPGFRPFWQFEPKRKRHNESPSIPLSETISRQLMSSAKQLGRVPDLLKVAGKMTQSALRLGHSPLKAPFFNVPRSRLNQSPSRTRGVALARLPVSHFSYLSKMTGTSINDLVLTVCDIALQRYLAEHNWAVNAPLMALMPLSMSKHSDRSAHGNKLTYGLVALGTPGQSAGERLLAISRHSAGVKEEVFSAPEAYTEVVIGASFLSILEGRMKLNKFLPPTSNLVISNVPGPKQAIYFAGARMISGYPLSVLMPDQSLNITFASYDGAMQFGLVGCSDTLPDLESLPGYLADALAELTQDLIYVAGAIVIAELERLRPPESNRPRL